ncbi:programmed cell death protein 7 [Haplochromis burtoni]|uniref:programmed cell death protein 7 n=1 Tax=Haplochromis burtoni TaxID=8153 RepID=UPI0006C93FD5|nr:programmed cell death protein 7 [Haplochromis burtoni]
MDSSYRSDTSGYNSRYVHSQYSHPGLHEARELDLTAPPWTPPPAYDARPFGVGFTGPPFAQPYGFDPSVPPPGFGCPPPGHLLNVPLPSIPGAPQELQTRPHAPRCDRELASNRSHTEHRGPVATRDPDDDVTRQRKQDTKWVRQFLQATGKKSCGRLQSQHSPQLSSISSLRQALYGAAQLISRLEDLCHTLTHSLHGDGEWTHSYLRALGIKAELADKARLLADTSRLGELKAQVSRAACRRLRRLRARREAKTEEKDAEERRSLKETAVDKWRMKLMQEVEEKKKEKELKMAADSVLCEVRKKQADVKRMQDILRSLEKLRRLRREAVSKKGIVTELQNDEVFSSTLEQLRMVIKRRTVVYSAEEKALMVMLEGEQEEERRRERERRVRKERERQLQRKHRVDSMLFGEEFPGSCALQPFRDYYSQAEHSLPALIHVRKEWDTCLVAVDHPGSSSVPQSWVLPNPPSDQAWASALQTSDTDCENL